MIDATYKGAFHKITNRGIEGRNIFSGSSLKTFFLELLKKTSEKLNIRLLSYCITDNRYCLVLQNSSGRLPDFMRELDGQYAINYRKKEGKKGYIFPDRYKSTLIQEGLYLRKVIIHVLLSPVREGITNNPYNYRWSSIREYYSNSKETIVDKMFTEKIFKSKSIFNKLLEELRNENLRAKRTRFGAVIGGEKFGEEAIKKCYELGNEGGETKEMVLFQDQTAEINHILDTVDIVINLFDKKIKVKGDKIKEHAKPDKELKSEFLVALKDKASTRLIDTPLFHHLKDSSFGQLCKRAKDKFMDT